MLVDEVVVLKNAVSCSCCFALEVLYDFG